MTASEHMKNMSKTAMYTVMDGRKSYLCNFIECLIYFGNREVKRIAYPNYTDESNNNELPILYLAKLK